MPRLMMGPVLGSSLGGGQPTIAPCLIAAPKSQQYGPPTRSVFFNSSLRQVIGLEEETWSRLGQLNRTFWEELEYGTEREMRGLGVPRVGSRRGHVLEGSGSSSLSQAFRTTL